MNCCLSLLWNGWHHLKWMKNSWEISLNSAVFHTLCGHFSCLRKVEEHSYHMRKLVSKAGIRNYVPQFTVGCNYLSLPEIPASGNKVLISCVILIHILQGWRAVRGQLRICRQKQGSQRGISNYILQFTVGCNYLSLPEIPASGNNVLN